MFYSSLRQSSNNLVPSRYLAFSSLFFNSADTYYKSTYKEDFRVVVESDGTVIWEFGGVMKTSCALDISNYPFDRQVCNVEVQNWAYTDDLVSVAHVKHFKVIKFTH